MRIFKDARKYSRTMTFFLRIKDMAIYRFDRRSLGVQKRLAILILRSTTFRTRFRVVASGGASGARCPPFSRLAPGCYIHPILYFKNVPPSFWFLAPPAAKSWRRAWQGFSNKCFNVAKS